MNRACSKWQLCRATLLVLSLLRMDASALGAGRAPLSQQRASRYFAPFVEALPSMAGKTVAVTGASRGLGLATALALAEKGCAVVVLSRKSAVATKATQEIAARATGPAPTFIECDLLDFSSVTRAAAALRVRVADGGLDVLCCNAGVMLQRDRASADGFDVTCSTNVLSHFLLARELMPALERAAASRGEARVVSMSSMSGFGAPKLDTRFFEKQGGNLGGDRASYERYHQSKLANLLFTSALHEKLAAKASGVKALACHPGVCATDMFLHVMQRSGQQPDLSKVPSVEDGSLAQLKCICDPSVVSGTLFGPEGMGGPPVEVALAPPRILVDAESKAALWACCERAVGTFDL